MKRQAAFSGEGAFFKGCLHLHSTRSDGQDTPEDLVRLYTDHGYDFISLTDHRLYTRKNPVAGSDLTVIPGMELDSGALNIGIPGDNGWSFFHTVLIGPDDERNGYEEGQPICAWDACDQDAYQKRYLDDAKKNANLAIYSHPDFSSAPTRHFERLSVFAVEVYNNMCAMACDTDCNNAYFWDELLRQGKRVYGVAVDDAHDSRYYFGGFVMVKAPSRSVNDLLDALQNGAFYASTGPIIRDFYVKDGVAHLVADGRVDVTFYFSRRFGTKVHPMPGVRMTEATVEVGDFAYVRAMVTDEQGRRAWTNPIFLKEELFR